MSVINYMGIYDNPEKYAKFCMIPLELAEIECKKQFNIIKRREAACICPKCKQRGIGIIDGEDGVDDYLECKNCKETYSFEDINDSYLLTSSAYFDSVLYFSSKNDEERKQLWLDACGAKTLEEWVVFATKMIQG